MAPDHSIIVPIVAELHGVEIARFDAKWLPCPHGKSMASFRNGGPCGGRPHRDADSGISTDLDGRLWRQGLITTMFIVDGAAHQPSGFEPSHTEFDSIINLYSMRAHQRGFRLALPANSRTAAHEIDMEAKPIRIGGSVVGISRRIQGLCPALLLEWKSILDADDLDAHASHPILATLTPFRI